MKEGMQQDCEYLAKKMYYPVKSGRQIIGFINTGRSKGKADRVTIEDCESMKEKGFRATISNGTIIGFAKTGI